MIDWDRYRQVEYAWQREYAVPVPLKPLSTVTRPVEGLNRGLRLDDDDEQLQWKIDDYAKAEQWQGRGGSRKWTRI